MTWADRMRALRMDLTPWRGSRDFRLLLLGGSVFYLGAMVTYVAIPYQVYTLTDSNFAVGAIGLVELVPLVVFGLYGGALADHVDRRRLMLGTGAAMVLLTGVLAVNAFRDDPSVPLIFVVAALLVSASAMQRPSREALMPRTVPHDQLTAAQALMSFGMQLGLFGGPLLGGLLVAYAGVGWCFLVDVCGLVLATFLYSLMGHYPHRSETTPPSLRGIGEGIAYAARRRDLLGTVVLVLASFLLAMPVVLFPALVEEVFERPELLGLLYASETAGAMLATALSGWTSRVHHHGRAIVIAAAAYGGAICLAGLMPSIWLVLVCLTLAGSADMISALFRATVWNQTIPETMRGRLAGIEMLSYSVGPLGGQVRAGITADLWSVRGAIASGGAACIAGVVITAGILRDFWSYDSRTNEYAVAERAARAEAGEE